MDSKIRINNFRSALENTRYSLTLGCILVAAIREYGVECVDQLIQQRYDKIFICLLTIEYADDYITRRNATHDFKYLLSPVDLDKGELKYE